MTHATKPGVRVHVNVQGSNELSLGGARYKILFIDEYSRYTITAYLAHKDESSKAIKEYVV